MHPTLLQYPHINSFPALLLLGFVFGYLLAVARGKRMGIGRYHIDNLVLILAVAGLAGSRFFARYFYLKTGFWSAFKVWEGPGLVFYGGLIFSVLAVLIYAKLRNASKTALMDCLAPSVALGLAFGRIGCFLGGCCWGDVCLTPVQARTIQDPVALSQIYSLPVLSPSTLPLAVTFPARSDIFAQHQKLGLVSASEGRSLPVHPVQLYEAAAAFLLAFILHYWSRKKALLPGQVLIGLLAGYSVIRFCTEFLRADNKLIYWGLSISQVISIGLLLAAVAAWLLMLKKQKNPGISRVPAEVRPNPVVMLR